ncbi:MAG: S8 family serine peptidase, partial [Oscillospiraceae bacterium]|nr:S8 family serine peptidase [Oscillospiraceae bacterium]
MRKGFPIKRFLALVLTFAFVVGVCAAASLPAADVIGAPASALFAAEIAEGAVTAHVGNPDGEAGQPLVSVVVLAVYTDAGTLAHAEAHTLEVPAGASLPHTFAADLADYPAENHTYRVFFWDASYRPLSDAVVPGEPSGPSPGIPISLTVSTVFPDTTTEGRVDVTYSAVPSTDAVITEVSYSIGGGAPDYLYLRGDDQVSPKGVLGTGTVFLTPGENVIVFFVKDSAGQTASYTVPNRPVYDEGSEPPPFTEEDLVLSEDGVSYFVKGRLVIFAVTGATETEVAAAVATVGGVVRSVNHTLDMYVVAVSGETEAALLDVAEQLWDAFPALFDLVDLEYVEPVAPEAGATADPWWDSDQWGLEAIRATDAWALSRYMREIKLGVLDNGVAYAHEDLQIPAANVKNNGAANQSHGTHVIGTIGAIHGNNVGLAGAADMRRGNLYGYDVYTTAASTAAVNQADGLAWLVQRGVKVINVSLGSASATAANRLTLERAMKKLLEKGYDYLIVQSAGNGNSSGLPIDANGAGVFRSVTDAALQQRILLVGSTDPNGALEATSNYGARVDVVAPGTSIYSAAPGDQYQRLSGSSSAAAHVTGVAGLAWSVNPGL